MLTCARAIIVLAYSIACRGVDLGPNDTLFVFAWIVTTPSATVCEEALVQQQYCKKIKYKKWYDFLLTVDDESYYSSTSTTLFCV